jgi:hypothetical protein
MVPNLRKRSSTSRSVVFLPKRTPRLSVEALGGCGGPGAEKYHLLASPLRDVHGEAAHVEPRPRHLDSGSDTMQEPNR